MQIGDLNILFGHHPEVKSLQRMVSGTQDRHVLVSGLRASARALALSALTQRLFIVMDNAEAAQYMYSDLRSLTAGQVDLRPASPDSPATPDEPVEQTTAAATAPTTEKVRVNDSELGEIWVDELPGVEKNTLQNDRFYEEGGFKRYSADGVTALVGIDVSESSGDIDWDRVKAAGVDFAMVRLGGRGYGEDGAMYADERALEYIKGAQAVGIKAGGYFFSQAISSDEAAEEAKFIMDLLGDTKLDYPIAFDWEIIKNDEARTDGVSSTQATECARVFCETIKSFGYKPMIYSPSRELYFKYDLTKLKDFDIWYCEYADVPEFYYQFTMWQYSETGSVPGIEGSVDLNICFTNIADY